jgi:hypothetical protein
MATVLDPLKNTNEEHLKWHEKLQDTITHSGLDMLDMIEMRVFNWKKEK